MAKKSARPARRAAKPARRASTKAARGKTTKKKTARVASARPARKPAARAATARPRPNPVQEIAKRIVDVTINGDDAGTLALYADDVESKEMGQPPMNGIDAIKGKIEMWHGMTTSASFRPRSVVVDGNTVVVEWEGTVTLAASGKTVTLDEIAIHEIANGKIVRERFYYDPSQLQG